jgi:hypothetical protein
VGVVAHYQSIPNERAFDGGDGAPDAGIVRRQEAYDRDEEQTRVQCRIAERLDERVLLGVVPMLAHFLMNRRPDISPALEGAVEPEFLD